jgi:hypothetical protein
MYFPCFPSFPVSGHTESEESILEGRGYLWCQSLLHPKETLQGFPLQQDYYRLQSRKRAGAVTLLLKNISKSKLIFDWKTRQAKGLLTFCQREWNDFDFGRCHLKRSCSQWSDREWNPCPNSKLVVVDSQDILWECYVWKRLKVLRHHVRREQPKNFLLEESRSSLCFQDFLYKRVHLVWQFYSVWKNVCRSKVAVFARNVCCLFPFTPCLVWCR